MRVTFLEHSGFLVELPSVTLLFDWWKGELPALRPGVPLLVFSSHRHEDHFKPEIFSLDAAASLLIVFLFSHRVPTFRAFVYHKQLSVVRATQQLVGTFQTVVATFGTKIVIPILFNKNTD